MQTKAADAFTKFFTPKDTALLGHLRFTVNHRLGDGLFHGIKQRHVFTEKEYCDCGGRVDAQDAEDLAYLLANKASWAPCMRKSELHSPMSSLLLTLEDMNPVFNDINELEKFMAKESPSFSETLDAARKMVEVSILTRALKSIKIDSGKPTSLSVTSERIASLLLSGFKAETLELFGLSASKEEASEFLLVDSESSFDAFSNYFRSQQPSEENYASDARFKRDSEVLFRKYLTELLIRDASVAELDFNFISSTGAILLTSQSFADFLTKENYLPQELHSQVAVTEEERATLKGVVQLHINKETNTKFNTADDVINKIIKPALRTFESVNT